MEAFTDDIPATHSRWYVEQEKHAELTMKILMQITIIISVRKYLYFRTEHPIIESTPVRYLSALAGRLVQGLIMHTRLKAWAARAYRPAVNSSCIANN